MQEIKEQDARDKEYLVEVVRQYDRKPDWVRTERGFTNLEKAKEYYESISLAQGKKHWEKKRLGRNLGQDYQWLRVDFSEGY